MGQRLEIPVIVCHSRSLEGQANVGITLAGIKTMKFFCRHCDEIVKDKPYRVISEEKGVILLDMMVCHSCYEKARELGLYSEAIPLYRKPRRLSRRLSA